MPTHKKTQSERFKGPAKYMEYLFARVLVTVLQRLPISLAYRMGRCVGWVCWKLLKRRREIVRKNLVIVNAWLAEDESRIKDREAFDMPLEAQVREVFERSGANLFSGFTFSSMRADQASTCLRLEGVEVLKEALASSNGAIVLLAHMGPWEALAQLPGLAKAYGIEAPFGAVYRAFNNAYLENWFKGQRERSGTKMFSSRYRFYAPADFARNGGMLGVLADQRASGGERVSFFEMNTSATPLPGLLHLRSKARIVALSIRTVSECKWRLCFRAVDFGSVPAEARRQIVSAKTASVIETSLSDSVLDGFWFHNRFKDTNKE